MLPSRREQTKTPPNERLVQGRIKNFIRDTTLIHGFSRALCGHCHASATDVCAHVAKYSAEHFKRHARMSPTCARCPIPCSRHLFRTLSGPFDDLFYTRLSAPRALCDSIAAVISASTVSLREVYHIMRRMSSKICNFNKVKLHRRQNAMREPLRGSRMTERYYAVSAFS